MICLSIALLLDILRNADGSEYHKLRVKAMECACLIGQSVGGYEVSLPDAMCTAIAVEYDVLLPDSTVLIEQLIRIQCQFYAVFIILAGNRQPENPTIDPSDTQLQHYLSWDVGKDLSGYGTQC